MKLRKRLGAMLLSAAMLLTALPAIAPTASAATMGSIVLTIGSTNMTVNGVSKAIDTNGSKPVLDKGGYTMLPLRGVVEAMGGSLSWDAAKRTSTITKDGQTVVIPTGSTKLTVDGVQKDMLANGGVYKAAYINTAGKSMVHVRALEAFKDTKCTWNNATSQVTVSYPMSGSNVTSKNYRVDLINDTGAEIDTLYYKEAGSYSYSKNVLTSTLKKNGTASFYIAVPSNATTRLYDFYSEGDAGTKFFNGLNLNNVNAYVTVVLKEGGKFEQAADKTIEVAGDTALKFVNDSKLDIEELRMSTTSSFSSSDDILSGTVDAGDDATIDVDLDGTKTWYFQAIDEDGHKYTSGKVTFSSATVESATLTFSSSKKLSLTKGGSSSSSGDTTLTFDNQSGDTITAIYMATDKDDLEDADDLLDGDELDDDDDVDVDFDLDSEKKWYITVEFDEKKDLEEKSLTFEYKDPKSATIIIKSSSVTVDDEKKGSGSSSRGALGLALVNDTDTEIYEAYLVDDGEDFDLDDYDDILDGDGLDEGEYVVLDEAADDEEYDLVLFYDDSDEDEDAYGYFSVDFSDATDYASVWINDDSSDDFDGEYYTDEDDTMVVGVYNNTDEDLTDLEVCDDDTDDSVETLDDIDGGYYDYFEIDTDDTSDIYIESSESDDYSADLAGEAPFAVINLNDTDGDCDVDSIDDL